MSDLVPVFEDLSFYNYPDSQKSRYSNLVSTFEKSFSHKPEFIARSPGRVNLIGDHIDYCYFSALPTAIDYDVIEAIGAIEHPETPRVVIVNTDPSFEPETIELPTDGSIVKIDTSIDTWTNYYRCSLIVAQKFIQEKYPQLLKKGILTSMNVTLDGTVPMGGGLSSSAAICVASTLGILKANGVDKVTKEDLTRITVVSEHYVGVNTGGMDQCASVYGEKNKVLFIEFSPKLKATPFGFPEIKPPHKPLAFLITNTLAQANKKETAPVNYNLRVVEVSTAAEILAHINGLKLLQNSNLNTGTLRGFMDYYFTQTLNKSNWNGIDLNEGISRLNELLTKIEIWFTEEEKIGFTTEEAAKKLDLTIEEFEKKFLNLFPVKYEKLKIYQRAKHVFAESLRVLQTLKLLEESQNNKNFNPDDFLQEFGNILNESQKSLVTLCENSKKECDELYSVAIENGSIGSRITGAGFGGSLIHLTTEDKLNNLIDQLKEKYYKKNFPDITEEELEQAIVVTKPATGSCIVNKVDF